MAFVITARQHYSDHHKTAGQDPICQWLRKHKLNPEDVYRVTIDEEAHKATVSMYAPDELAGQRRTPIGEKEFPYDS